MRLLVLLLLTSCAINPAIKEANHRKAIELCSSHGGIKGYTIDKSIFGSHKTFLTCEDGSQMVFTP